MVRSARDTSERVPSKNKDALSDKLSDQNMWVKLEKINNRMDKYWSR